MVRPATPGTAVVLAATIVLLIVSINTPIIKSVYFLSANLSVSVASVSLDGKVNLGTLGWCVEGIGTKAVCQGPQLGYELEADQIFGNNTSFSLPNSLIKWLTYALVIHPIAAGLGAIAFVSGCASHFREFSRARFTTCITSFATVVSLIAFVFDIVLFSIARSRINDASNNDVALNASLGNGVWLTLVGFVLMLMSGCFFGFGHCCMNRRPTQAEKDRNRPQMDASYASDARREAEDLEKAEKRRRAGNTTGASGLPAFPEEQVPLTAVPKAEEMYSEESVASQDIAGVGTGYGRRHQQPSDPLGRPSRANTVPGAGHGYDLQHQPPYSAGRYPANPMAAQNQAEPFTSMYDDPASQSHYGHAHSQRRPQGSQPTYAGGRNEPYRQSSNGSAQYYDAGQNQGPPAFPTATQHGGQDPLDFVAMGDAVQTSPTYPPAGGYYNEQRTYEPATHSAGRAQQASASPWEPPLANTNAHTVLQGDSFHAAAAASRHRQSRSDAVSAQPAYQSGGDYAAYPQQQHTDEYHLHTGAYAPSTDVARHASPALYRNTEHLGIASPSKAPAFSPTGDIYDSYYTESPSRNEPPPAIPYIPESDMPSPSYHSAEPYPTYGGTTYR